MKDLNNKLDRLDPNVYSKRDAEIISSWKERVPKLMAQADFISHPITLDLKKEVQAVIASINAKLSNDPSLTTEERLGFFGEKKAHQFYLDALSQNPSSELETIERAIDLETE